MFVKFRKLRLPVKVFQALILIMLSVQQCYSSFSPLQCFNGVWKTEVYNVRGDDNDGGFVYVNDRHQILSNKNTDSYLYKISTTLPKARHLPAENKSYAFYLFHPTTETFLCWKNSKSGTMIAMTYQQMMKNNHRRFCKFIDGPPKDSRFTNTHLNLKMAISQSILMQFNNKGRNISHKRVQKCQNVKKRIESELNSSRIKRRRSKMCKGNDIFLLYSTQTENCCSEAYELLCNNKTAQMEEIKVQCEILGRGVNKINRCPHHQ